MPIKAPFVPGVSGIKSGVSGSALFSIDLIPAPVILVGEFTGLSLTIKSYRVPLKRSIQQVIAPKILLSFDIGGLPKEWEILSAKTIKQRKQLGYSEGPVLIRSKKLRRAAGSLARWTIEKDKAYVGDNWPQTVWYGPVQHSGMGDQFNSSSYIPSRPFMLIQDDDQPKIEAIFIEWFKERLMASGFHK